MGYTQRGRGWRDKPLGQRTINQIIIIIVTAFLTRGQAGWPRQSFKFGRYEYKSAVDSKFMLAHTRTTTNYYSSTVYSSTRLTR